MSTKSATDTIVLEAGASSPENVSPDAVAAQMTEMTETLAPDPNKPKEPGFTHIQEEAVAQATKAHDFVERALLKAYSMVADGVHDELSTSRSSIRTLLSQWRACWPGGRPKVVSREDELTMPDEI